MANSTDYGAFVNTTQVWDVAQVNSLDVNSPAFKELLIRMYQQLNTIANVLNVKDSGFYDTQEFVSGQLFFPNPALNSSSTTTPTYRQGQRQVVICGTLPNMSTKLVPHGITVTPATSWTRIYGAATDPVGLTGITLPYSNPSVDIYPDDTNINITTFADFTNYTLSLVVVEYLQS